MSKACHAKKRFWLQDLFSHGVTGSFNSDFVKQSRKPPDICFMFVQVQSLRVQVAQKDMFISELLDRIAIVECEVRHSFSTGASIKVWCEFSAARSK